MDTWKRARRLEVKWISRIVPVTLLIWLIMMGYAIATRREPRWIESLLYNVYNVLLIFLLYAAQHSLSERLARTLVVTPVSLRLKDYDLSPILGKTTIRILHLLTTRHRRLTRCADIALLLDGAVDPVHMSECRRCEGEPAKASLCGRYRRIYNCILDIRRFLEALNLGAIAYPANKARIVQEGWRLVLSRDVRVILENAAGERSAGMPDEHGRTR